MRVLRQLFTPAKYLRIVASTPDKLWIDWGFPLLGASVVTVIWVIWPTAMPVAGKTGVIESVGSFMQVLVGFYVAALAAVATFQGSSLDENVLGMSLDGKPFKRRHFLSYLFGYLALLSLALYVGMLFRQLPISILANGPPEVRQIAKVGLVFVHQFIFWQMIFVTLLGLHYLSDRIHRSNTD